jgi:hypothetical protein
VSWITAPRSLVMTPMTADGAGSARLRLASNRPSVGTEAQHLDAGEQGAGAGILHPLGNELIGRAFGVGRDAAGGDHLDAVLRHHAEA